jgi:hypothetical protein
MWAMMLKSFRGSCVASMHSQATDAHPLDQLRGDAFRINHSLIRGYI